MIFLLPAAAAVSLATAAFFVARSTDPADAKALGVRHTALITATVAGLVAALSWIGFDGEQAAIQALPPRELRFVPIVFALVALVGVALAPLATHPPRTIARLLLIVAIAQASLATTIPAVFALCAAMTAWITWWELKETTGASEIAQLFAGFHSASVALMLVGMVFLANDFRATGGGLFLLAMAIRAGLLPVHSWFVGFVERAPMGVVVAFVTPQLSVLPFLTTASFALPIPSARILVVAAAVAATVSAGLGLVQVEARRAAAFLMISQTALVLIGAGSQSNVARAGAFVTWQALALALAGFAMTVAALEARRGALSLRQPGGLSALTPKLGTALLILGLASVGFPLTMGFVGEDLLIQGAEESWLRMIPIVTAALNGITVTRCFLYLFSGGSALIGECDLRPREVAAVTVLILTLVVGGVWPRFIVPTPSARPQNAVAPDRGDPAPLRAPIQPTIARNDTASATRPLFFDHAADYRFDDSRCVAARIRPATR